VEAGSGRVDQGGEEGGISVVTRLLGEVRVDEMKGEVSLDNSEVVATAAEQDFSLHSQVFLL
jgi:hypothetical protein